MNEHLYNKIQRIINILMMLCLLPVLYYKNLYALTGVSFLQVGVILYRFRSELKNIIPWGGYANLLTLFRWLCFWFVAIFFTLLGDVLIFVILLVGIVLDAFDGFIARKRKEVTSAGALLDIEADSYFMAVICAIFYLKGYEFPILLVAGFLRWAYLTAKLAAGWEYVVEGRQPHARYMALASFIALFSAFVLQDLATYLLLFAGYIIVISFGISYFLLLRQQWTKK